MLPFLFFRPSHFFVFILLFFPISGGMASPFFAVRLTSHHCLKVSLTFSYWQATRFTSPVCRNSFVLRTFFACWPVLVCVGSLFLFFSVLVLGLIGTFALL